MGDRENPIKFGPEWLRNIPRERGSGNTVSQGGNATSTGPGGAGPNTRRGGTSSDSSPFISAGTSANGTVGLRVQLANLRYGREEMLALFEAAADPPPELTNNELLYQSRSKQPFALSTTFDDEMREGLRSGSHTGAVPAERFGAGRGSGRGLTPTPDNPRPRFRTTGSTVPTRPRNLPSTSEGHFSGNSLEGSVRPQLTQRNPRYQSNTEHKAMFYPNYAGANTFRSKRQTNTSSTNWRSSQVRESGDEWRSEPTRARPGQDRERDRERPGPSYNRRSSDHEETIPEWAFANAEACGGTFDSSGAFHGYSNDDSNLPKNQDNGYSLSRSRTHNSLSRSKTVEEGSEEWWASEKAKKLSPKRFDAGDIKFKQGAGLQDGPLAQNLKPNASNEEHYAESQKELPADVLEEPVKDSGDFGDNNYNNNKPTYKQQFSESKPFDSMMRQDINIEEAHSASANDQRGNFQSVMITPNNSLRQKHQNIVSAPNDSAINHPQGLMSMKYTSHSTEKDIPSKHQAFEDKILDDFLDLTLETGEIGASVLMGPPSGGGRSSGLANQSLPQMQDRGLHQGLQTSNLQNQGLSINNVQNLSSLGVPNLNNPSMNPHVMSPQLEFGNSLGMPLQGVPQGVMLNNQGLDGSGLQRGASGLPAFQNTSITGIPNSNVANNSLFLGNSSSATGDIPMPSHGGAMFPMHGLQHSGSQGTFSASVFNNMMQQPPPAPATDQWYYEDPDKNVQGPFTCREMYNWYRAGFFTPSLMVRRACEREMRPLGSYGPLVPFVQMDVLPPFPMSGFDTRPSMSQSGIGLSVMPIPNNDQPIPMPPSAQNAMQNSFQNMQAAPMSPLHNTILAPPIHLIQNTVIGQNVMPINMPPLMRTAAQGGMPVFGSANLNRNPSVAQQQNVFDSLWGQAPQDVMWMQRNPPIENKVNNLPLYFWEQQPTAIARNQLLPEGIKKEMKTEDQILAQLRASQNMSTQPNPIIQQKPETKPLTTTAATKPIDAFSSPLTATYFELHKIIHKDIPDPAPGTEPSVETQPPVHEKSNKAEQPTPEINNTKSQQNMTKIETKTAKQSKESEKTVKTKENINNKTKNKKKDEKKDDAGDVKVKDDDSNNTEKRSVESSPVKTKKEEKTSKKDLDKEKKEWIKEGFTIVKGSEKGITKDNKKKAEEAKQVEAEKKKKEPLPASFFVIPRSLAYNQKVAEEKRKQEEYTKKQQGQQQPKQASESIMKKAPWSATQSCLSTNMEGLTLAEIQRLEREKKLEQMKEQQQMMQMIAQQQAQQLAREQEMQASLAWAKRNTSIAAVISPSLPEIQAQEQVSRKYAPAPEEDKLLVNHAAWGNAPNPGGFWDSSAHSKNLETKTQEQKLPEPKPQEPNEPEPKPDVQKVVKVKIVPASSSNNNSSAAPASSAPAKKVTSPAAEFETWCTTTLKSWSSKIDVPTFIGFLRDIESPYEVKDYVRCYLGDTKDSGDFARQFLERRSKLLRVGMVTPSDDLCSPAMAVNPRSNSQSDYQEGKGKKVKKNKMLKVDARFLGFSATAAEDRINVGDIDNTV